MVLKKKPKGVNHSYFGKLIYLWKHEKPFL